MSGTADLGLLTLPIDDPNLVSEPVMREELLLVTSPQHPLARKKHIVPQDLARQPFVLFEAASLPDLPSTQIAAYRTPTSAAGATLDRELARHRRNA